MRGILILLFLVFAIFLIRAIVKAGLRSIEGHQSRQEYRRRAGTLLLLGILTFLAGFGSRWAIERRKRILTSKE